MKSVALSTVCALTLLAGLSACESGTRDAASTPTPVVNTTPGVMLPDFTGLVTQATPSVVNISATKKPQSERSGLKGQPEMPDMMEEWLRRFFGGIPGQPGHPQREPERTAATGSGFIISADGDILTNNHVVEGADEVVVKLSDRRQLVAKVVGTDPLSDVALIHIDAKDLPAVKIGNLDQLRVGEWVLAIGSPFGFEHSVTAGIVSAKGRSLATDQYVPFIQTDVAINPGNSGGPLFNLRGEVVGINSQIFSRSGGYMGLSFAIPMDTVMQTIKQLRDKGHVARGWLGVVVQEVDRGLAESFGLDKPEGALVARVTEDSPADKAGLEPGDVIVAFDGETVTNSGSLPALVGRTTPGKSVELGIIRNGDRKTLSITPGELNEDLLKTQGDTPAKGKSDSDRSSWGIRFRDLQPDERRELKVPEGGALVVGVSEGPAAVAGIRPGDVILRLNGQRIEQAQDLATAIKALKKGKTSAILVQRDGSPRYLAVDGSE